MTQQTHMPFRSALPWLLFIASIFFLNFIGRVILSPLLVYMEADLNITHAQAGRFFLDIAVGYSISLLLSGFISSRFTHNRVIAIMPILMGVLFILMGYSRSLFEMEALLFIFGLSIGFYLPSGVASLTSLVSPNSFGKAMAVHELAPNLSFILAPLMAEMLLPPLGWRGIFIAIGIGSIIIGVLFLRFGRGGDFYGAPPSFHLTGTILREPSFWVLAIFFCMGIGASFAPYSILPLFLVNERGMEPTWANQLLSLSRVAGPFVAFGGGWASDNLGPKRTLMYYLILTGILTALIGVLTGVALTAVVIIQPMLTVCFFPAGFAAIARLFPPKVGSMVISLMVPLGVLAGNGVFPAIFGYLGDRGMFAMGFVALGFSLLVAVPLIWLLKPSRLMLVEQDAAA